MTDPALVAKKLAAIETALADLRRLAQPERLTTDLLQRRFVEHTPADRHPGVAGRGLAHRVGQSAREPRTHREVFALLAQAGWIDATLLDSLSRMVGFRNILVHGYDDVDLDVVRDVLECRLTDLETFVAAIRARC